VHVNVTVLHKLQSTVCTYEFFSFESRTVFLWWASIVIRTWLCFSHLVLALWLANLSVAQKADANVQNAHEGHCPSRSSLL